MLQTSPNSEDDLFALFIRTFAGKRFLSAVKTAVIACSKTYANTEIKTRTCVERDGLLHEQEFQPSVRDHRKSSVCLKDTTLSTPKARRRLL